MQKLKQFYAILGGGVLRSASLTWLLSIIYLFANLGITLPLNAGPNMVTTLYLMWLVMIFTALQISKLDIRFIVNNIEKWQFKLFAYLFYTSAWGVILLRYYSDGNYGMLARNTWIISPLSEVFLYCFVYLPISWISQEAFHSIFTYNIDVAVSVLASFAALEIFLRFVRHIVRTRKIQTKNMGLRQFFISWSASALRLILIVWVLMIVNQFYNLGMNAYPILLFLYMVLYFSKLDIKFIIDNIGKWRFRIIVYVFYALAWVMVLFRQSNHEKGLLLMFDKLLIAPVSEVLLSIFVYMPISLIDRNIFDYIVLHRIDIVLSVSASFVILEIFLRLSKRILVRIGRIEADEGRTNKPVMTS
jgi:hypothetical protein